MSSSETSRFTDWRVEVIHACLRLSDRQWDFFFSPPSQSLAALSFASCKRLWIIQPVIATIEENNSKKKRTVKYTKCQVKTEVMRIPNITVYLVFNLKRKSLGVTLKRINLCTISTCQNEIDFHVVSFS